MKTNKKTIKCSCGHAIVSKNTTTKNIIKCFKCNTYIEQINGEWVNTGLIVDRKTNTIGDLLKIQLQRHQEQKNNLEALEIKKILIKAQ